MVKYKVAYATGSRAEYGIVRNYLKLLNNDTDIDFSLLVTGSHLERKYGYTVDEISKDGFKVDLTVDMKLDNSNNASIIHSMSIALDSFGSFFEKNKFDLLIILGDRYEMMAVAIAAAMQKIPILHLHGGEVTFGNYDEFIRHSITKMSTFHFTSTPVYQNRVIQMGELPSNVYYLGALGAENCTCIDETNVVEWVKELPENKYFVVAFHPETLTNNGILDQVHEILTAIDDYIGDYRFVFIGTNADTNSDVIQLEWKKYSESNSNAIYVCNLNVDSYLFLVKHSVALIGNSSSGIIEAPSLGTHSVNIGDRQKGRVASNSVISVNCCKDQLINAIEHILRKPITDFDNPYYLANAHVEYYKKTKELLEKPFEAPKEFYDLIVE